MAKEEARLREAEAIAKLLAAQAELLSNSQTGNNETDTVLVDPTTGQRATDITSVRVDPFVRGAQARRQSKILSLSTLHRPAFPLKLDLSSAALRFVPDDIARSALASPVTLAPKSARPMATNELPPDLLAAFTAGSSEPLNLSTGIGDSAQTSSLASGHDVMSSELGTAEKPIDLDLDMDVGMGDLDLFGDSVAVQSNITSDGVLFGSNDDAAEVSTSMMNPGDNPDSEMGLLEAYHGVGGHDGSIFGTLGAVIENSEGSSSAILTGLTSNRTHPEAHPGAPTVIDNPSFDYQALGMDDIPDFNPNFFHSSDGSVEMSELLSIGANSQTIQVDEKNKGEPAPP